MVFTDYPIGPAELAVALEERGVDIVLGRRNSEYLPPFESPLNSPRRPVAGVRIWLTRVKTQSKH
jgi:hypothetical protein